MDEFALIDHYFRRESTGPGVVLGIGDDGAVIDVPPGCQLVSVIDSLVADVHFPQQLTAADLGYRAAAVNLSDLAAMGAEPRWMLLALTLPEADADWLEHFAAGLFDAADEFGLTLAGGDTTRGATRVVTVQMAGHVETGQFLRRDGCRPGDRIYVSGTPGDAAAGLAAMQAGENQEGLWQRFCRPAPRVSLGRAAVGLASAAIDISDGLCADLQHLLDASGCGAELDCAALPLSVELLTRAGKAGAQASALGGGDDYELLLTVATSKAAALEAAAADCGVRLTEIGEISEQGGLRLHSAAPGIAPGGYRHFAAASNDA